MRHMTDLQLEAYMSTWHGDETNFAELRMRKWYNPMRLLKGDYYYVAI